MARFKRLDAFTDWAGGIISGRRYGREDADDVDLDESTDPDQWGDPTRTSKKAWLWRRRHYLWAFCVISVIALMFVAGWSRTYLPELYGNPVVRVATIVAASASAGAFLAVNGFKNKIGSLGFLCLHIPNEAALVYLGDIDQDSEGNTLFTPIKGLDLLGMRGSKMRFDDLPDHVVENQSKMRRRVEGNDAVRIRVDDALAKRVEAVFGRFVLVLTDGLRWDPFGRESDIYTELPDTVDDETYREVVDSMEEMRRENRRLQSRVDELQEETDRLREKVSERREDIVSEFVKRHSELMDVQAINRRRSDDSNGESSWREAAAPYMDTDDDQ